MTDAIVTERLTKHYGGRRVVDSLDLRVPQGSVYGLLGRNGAGKSTAIKMLMGMVRPDSGTRHAAGRRRRQRYRTPTRARIAYLAEGHPLYGWMTIDDAVRFTRAFYPRWNDVLVDQILDHFELSRRQKFRRLSRGQQAQVSLALAVAPDPELLILDDPTLGLDTVVRRDFLESLIQIIQRQGRTILFSSHILGDVERVADRIGIMVSGVLRVDCRDGDVPRIGPQAGARIRRQPAGIAGDPRAGELPASRQQPRSRAGRLRRRAAGSGRSRSAAIDRSARPESGRRVHRIHPWAAAIAAHLCNGDQKMLKALVIKELRESAGIVAVGRAGGAVYAGDR